MLSLNIEIRSFLNVTKLGVKKNLQKTCSGYLFFFFLFPPIFINMNETIDYRHIRKYYFKRRNINIQDSILKKERGNNKINKYIK